MQVGLRIRPVLRVERQVVVDDHVDLRNVDTSRDDVRRDQDFGLAVPEALHDSVAFGRFELAVQRDDLVAFVGHSAGNLVGRVSSLPGTVKRSAARQPAMHHMPFAHLDKDDALSDREQIVQLDQNFILVLLVVAVCTEVRSAQLAEYGTKCKHTHEELLDRIEGELLLLQADLVGARSEPDGEIPDDFGKGGGEQDDLRVLGHLQNEAAGAKEGQTRYTPIWSNQRTDFLSVMLWSPIEPDSSILSASSRTNTLTSRRSRMRPLVTICRKCSADQRPGPPGQQSGGITDIDHGTRGADDDLLSQLGHASCPRVLAGEEALDGRVLAHALHDGQDLHREFSRRRDADGLLAVEGVRVRHRLRKKVEERACGAFRSMSIRESIVRANAAVLPVPD